MQKISFGFEALVIHKDKNDKKIWYCYSVKRNPEGFVCPGIKEDIKLYINSWDTIKKQVFNF